MSRSIGVDAHSDRSYRLGHEPLRTLLPHYAIPAVVGMLVSALYSIVDRIFIGQGVGEAAISGLALTFPILVFMQAFGMLVGTGAAARVSIFIGRGDNENAERVLGTAIVLTAITQLLTIVPCMIWLEDILRLLGGSDRIIPYAVDYLRIIIPANIFQTLALGYNAIMRASGYPTKAMYTMLISAAINVVLDALFIYVFDWGIAGAAWATVVAMLASAVFVMAHFFSKDSLIRFKLEFVRLDFGAMLSIVTIGLSPFSVQILGSVVGILYNRTFLYVCTSSEEIDRAIGAYGIVVSYAMVSVLLMLGIAQGMQPIVGYNYGAGQYERTYRTFRVCAGINLINAVVFACIVYFMPEWIALIFTSSPELVEISSSALRLCLLGFIAVGYQITSTQFLQSIGRAGKSFWLSISRQTLFLIPALLIFPRFWGLNGVWISSSVADICSAVFAFVLITLQQRQDMNSLQQIKPTL